MFHSTFHAGWKALLGVSAPNSDSGIQDVLIHYLQWFASMAAMEREEKVHGVLWLCLKRVYITSGSISIPSARTQ